MTQRADLSMFPEPPAGGPAEELFTWIFRTNHWNSPESRSGPGAELGQTEAVRAGLFRIIAAYGVRTVVDAGCGDFNWMRHVVAASDLDSYVGIELVPDLVRLNRARYGGPPVSFRQGDITRDALTGGDLVICRDCLVHLSNADCLAFLTNLAASGSEYLLSTTYPAELINRDTRDGHWRPINLTRPPFLLPPPIEFIDTEFTAGGRYHPGNGLGLWKIASIVERLTSPSA